MEFTIIDHIGVLNENPSGWRKELNIVSWNAGRPKFDIREWDPEHEHMTRGITLRTEEARELSKLLSERFSDNS